MKPRSVAIELPHSGAVRGLLHVGADVVHDHVLGLGHVDGRGPHRLGQAGSRVHLGDDLDHPVQRLVVGVDDHVDAVAEHVESGSVTSAATSIRASFQVRPVISQSIHTSLLYAQRST